MNVALEYKLILVSDHKNSVVYKLNILSLTGCKILVKLMKERRGEKEESFGVIVVPIETLLLLEMGGC